MRSAAKLLGFFAIFGVACVPLHEGGHYIISRMFGMGGSIEIDWIVGSGAFHGSGALETWEPALVCFWGGGIVALIYGAVLRFTAGRWDEWRRTPIRVLLGGQLGYAIAETFVPFNMDLYQILTPILIIGGMFIGIFISGLYIWKAWEYNQKKGRRENWTETAFSRS